MADKINDGGPAFPNLATITSTASLDENANPVLEHKQFTQAGMSLRAWMAGTVAAGYRAARVYHAGAYPWESKLWSSQEVARSAVRDADALIAELGKTQ